MREQVEISGHQFRSEWYCLVHIKLCSNSREVLSGTTCLVLGLKQTDYKIVF